ncbi:hypothetical protein CsSME_00012265 [Camellia sinensis var. sinensis]
MLGYEGMEVINPEGGKDDAEEEAQRGRWKQETPDKMRELVELTFYKPPKILPSCVLTDFIRVRSSKLYAPHTQTHTA